MVANKKVRPKNLPHNIVVIELAEGERRIPHLPHLYIIRTQRTPEAVLKSLQEGKGPKWIIGNIRGLRTDLVPKYKPTRKLEVAEERVKRLKADLARQGFAINGDAKIWRIYVLNVEADVPPPIPIKNRGKLGKVVYVGQTSLTLPKREARHRGAPTKAGRYIGGRKTRGRNPKLNTALTPDNQLFTEADAKKFETQYSQKLKRAGYRVLGDGLTDPAKRRRSKSAR